MKRSDGKSVRSKAPVGDAVSYLGMSPAGQRRVVEVLSRLPQDVYEAVTDGSTHFLDAAASTVLDIHYYLADEDKETGLIITRLVVLADRVVDEDAPEDVAIGTIAHELGHLMQEREWDEAKLGGVDAEKDADARAVAWGFGQEVRAMHGDLKERGLFFEQYLDPDYTLDN